MGLVKKFRIPALPPSVNRMYKINYRTKQCYLDKSVQEFKHKAIHNIPHFMVSKNARLELLVEYHGKFINKGDGKPKRRDGQNLDKCLYDIIFEKLGLDDSIVWKGSWSKHHNEEEFTLVTIKEII